MKTALQWIAELAPQNPDKRFAVSNDHEAVGVWYDSQQRFIPLLCHTVNGEWVHMTMEVWANGKPMYAADKWIEIVSDGYTTRPLVNA